MGEAYLVDNWTTEEGYLVNGITSEGLMYEVENQERTLYECDLFDHSTLKQVLTQLLEDLFA